MSTNSLFLPHKVMYHIALAKCYRYVTHNFMWKKKEVRRHSPNSNTSVFFFSIDLCRVETAIDSTPPLPSKNRNNVVYRTLPLVRGTLFADCLKCQCSISLSEGMVGMFNFLFVRRSFLGKIFGLVPYSSDYKHDL